MIHRLPALTLPVALALSLSACGESRQARGEGDRRDSQRATGQAETAPGAQQDDATPAVAIPAYSSADGTEPLAVIFDASRDCEVVPGTSPALMSCRDVEYELPDTEGDPRFAHTIDAEHQAFLHVGCGFDLPTHADNVGSLPEYGVLNTKGLAYRIHIHKIENVPVGACRVALLAHTLVPDMHSLTLRSEQGVAAMPADVIEREREELLRMVDGMDAASTALQGAGSDLIPFANERQWANTLQTLMHRVEVTRAAYVDVFAPRTNLPVTCYSSPRAPRFELRHDRFTPGFCQLQVGFKPAYGDYVVTAVSATSDQGTDLIARDVDGTLSFMTSAASTGEQTVTFTIEAQSQQDSDKRVVTKHVLKRYRTEALVDRIGELRLRTSSSADALRPENGPVTLSGGTSLILDAPSTLPDDIAFDWSFGGAAVIKVVSANSCLRNTVTFAGDVADSEAIRTYRIGLAPAAGASAGCFETLKIEVDLSWLGVPARRTVSLDVRMDQ